MKIKKHSFVVGASAAVVAALLVGLAGSLPARSKAPPREKEKIVEEPVRLETRIDRPLLVRDGGLQDIVVKIDLTAVPHVKGKRSPLNIAVVLDRSGSMAGRKLEQAKQAAAMLVDQLAPGDVFSLVAYESEVEVLIPAAKVGDRKRLHRAIERIQSGGSTALYAGVQTGAEQLEEYLSDRRINRVLLLSDGLANVGPKSNREIGNLGRRIARNGIAVTTVGVGHDYNEDLMASLAEASDANYYYVQDVEKLDDVFAMELGELQSVVARRVVVEVTLPRGVKPLGFLGRPEKFRENKGKIEFNQMSGSQNRYVLLRCRVDPNSIKDLEYIAAVDLHYLNEMEEGGPEMAQRNEVKIGYTRDAELAANSIDKEVEVEWKLMDNAVETDKAIALADSGKHEEARAVVACQIDALCDLKKAAPEEQQAAIQEEIDLWKRNESEFTESGLSKGGRKILQWNSYTKRNSKQSVREGSK